MLRLCLQETVGPTDRCEVSGMPGHQNARDAIPPVGRLTGRGGLPSNRSAVWDPNAHSLESVLGNDSKPENLSMQRNSAMHNGQK